MSISKKINNISGKKAFYVLAFVGVFAFVVVGIFVSYEIQITILFFEVIYLIYATRYTGIEDSSHIAFSIVLLLASIVGLAIGNII